LMLRDLAHLGVWQIQDGSQIDCKSG